MRGLCSNHTKNRNKIETVAPYRFQYGTEKLDDTDSESFPCKRCSQYGSTTGYDPVSKRIASYSGFWYGCSYDDTMSTPAGLISFWAMRGQSSRSAQPPQGNLDEDRGWPILARAGRGRWSLLGACGSSLCHGSVEATADHSRIRGLIALERERNRKLVNPTGAVSLYTRVLDQSLNA